MGTRVVILGAGFGGLKLSARLSAELADQVDVTLIDQSDSFTFGFSKLDVMFARRTMDEVRIGYRTIAKPGVTFRQESVRSIDPERKQVVTNAGVYDADVLVVALGADLAPWATPGRAISCDRMKLTLTGEAMARQCRIPLVQARHARGLARGLPLVGEAAKETRCRSWERPGTPLWSRAAADVTASTAPD